MKRIFVLLSFACIALSGYSQEHASQYYMSYFAKYYRIDVVNYENEGFCAKIDLESSNETVTPSLYIKYANIPNFIVNLEIIKTRFVKHALQAVKDGTKNVKMPLESYFKRGFITYATNSKIYQDTNIKMKAFFEVKDDGQCLAVIKSPAFTAPKREAENNARSFFIFQTPDEFDELIDHLKKLTK